MRTFAFGEVARWRGGVFLLLPLRTLQVQSVSQSFFANASRNNSKGRDWHRGCEAGAYGWGGRDEIKSVKTLQKKKKKKKPVRPDTQHTRETRPPKQQRQRTNQIG